MLYIYMYTYIYIITQESNMYNIQHSWTAASSYCFHASTLQCCSPWVPQHHLGRGKFGRKHWEEPAVAPGGPLCAHDLVGPELQAWQHHRVGRLWVLHPLCTFCVCFSLLFGSAQTNEQPSTTWMVYVWLSFVCVLLSKNKHKLTENTWIKTNICIYVYMTHIEQYQTLSHANKDI